MGPRESSAIIAEKELGSSSISLPLSHVKAIPLRGFTAGTLRPRVVRWLA